jgi:hypothetical protein
MIKTAPYMRTSEECAGEFRRKFTVEIERHFARVSSYLPFHNRSSLTLPSGPKLNTIKHKVLNCEKGICGYKSLE